MEKKDEITTVILSFFLQKITMLKKLHQTILVVK